MNMFDWIQNSFEYLLTDLMEHAKIDWTVIWPDLHAWRSTIHHWLFGGHVPESILQCPTKLSMFCYYLQIATICWYEMMFFAVTVRPHLCSSKCHACHPINTFFSAWIRHKIHAEL